MQDKRYLIKADRSIKEALKREFSVCERTIQNALRFVTNGYTAETIRRRALELGGVLFQSVEQDEQQTNNNI